ncbi:MAG: hypothetical protein WBE91_11675 [Steroidobacteraceae bacterium]
MKSPALITVSTMFFVGAVVVFLAVCWKAPFAGPSFVRSDDPIALRKPALISGNADRFGRSRARRFGGNTDYDRDRSSPRAVQ